MADIGGTHSHAFEKTRNFLDRRLLDQTEPGWLGGGLKLGSRGYASFRRASLGMTIWYLKETVSVVMPIKAKRTKIDRKKDYNIE